MLRIERLYAGYGDRPVLRGVDLEVRPGEVVALVGPNGCGKTTLLKAITKVVPWTSGEVWAGEAPVADLSPRAISRLIAVVPQSPQLPVGYTAGEVVLMGRTPHLGLLDQESGEDFRIASESLARVGASGLSGRRVDELSGGERQSVLLARAIAQQAPILLLDEPTANLDIGHQIGVARLVQELAASGLVVLAAIHDLTLASLYADRVALMSNGRIVASGAPAQVLTAESIRQVYGSEVTVVAGLLDRPLVLPVEPST